MKLFFHILLIFLFPITVFSQFTDDFTDGNFTSNPTWGGDTSDFKVTVNELQIKAPSVAGSKYLSTSSQAVNSASWEFRVQLNFNPSSSNYGKVFLISNSSTLSGNLNGYYILIGGTDDDISLFSQSGSSSTKIIDGRNGTLNSTTVNVKIKVTRSSSGIWQLFSDTSASFTNYISEGITTDNTHLQSLFFGIECNYTSTRSDKFYFDDFVVTGTAVTDNTKPKIDSVKVISNTQLELVFSEPLDATTSQNTANYVVNNSIGNPSSAIQNTQDLSRVNLTFTTPFTLGSTNTITINNITDIAGNIINFTTKNFVYFLTATPSYREVVINEIFADPSPIIGLPDAEFIEIHNTTTTKFFDIAGWQITDGSSTSTLPPYILVPNSFVILVSSSTVGDFSLYPNKIGLTSFPSLNNTGETLTLLDNNGYTLDLVDYTISMYQDEIKKGGGFTLEQINPKSKCYNSKNWIGSYDSRGGTPGIINSAWDTTADTKKPTIISCIATSNSTIQITLDKTIDTITFINNLSIDKERSVTSYTTLNSFATQLELTISPALDTGVIYTIKIDSLIDCEGNFSMMSSETILANKNNKTSLIINEILFNPFTGEEDFVELYNNSDLFIDLINWSIGNENNGIAGNIKTITQHYLIKPREYVVINKNYELIKDRYPFHSPSNFIELKSLPTYGNENGTVYLLTPTLQESDKFSYSEDYHFALLRDNEGVSLERLDFNRTTQDASNWHSAAEEVGFATPGLKNSQSTPVLPEESTLSVLPKLFSPDNDGFEDNLTLSYNMPQSGFVGNITIYDPNGRQIKTLIQNQLLATSGSFSWDGTTDSNLKARIGRYIILFEYYDLDGNVKTEKTTCTIVHKL